MEIYCLTPHDKATMYPDVFYRFFRGKEISAKENGDQGPSMTHVNSVKGVYKDHSKAN